MYYRMNGGPECKQLRKYVLPLMIKFHKTMDAIDPNLVCDINDWMEKVLTIRIIRQMKKLGAFVYESTDKIPNKHYKRYQEELKKLKSPQGRFKAEQFYVMA